MKSINEDLNINMDKEAEELNERLGQELEERMELGCWAYCGSSNCAMYD